MSDKERELFEAHIEKVEGRKPMLWSRVWATSTRTDPLPEHLVGKYFGPGHQMAWVAWQARAALDAPVAAQPQSVNNGAGHGHVVPRPDGVKARCGGPAICRVCQGERAALEAQPPSAQELSDEAMRAICAYFNVTPGQVLDALAAKAQGGSHG